MLRTIIALALVTVAAGSAGAQLGLAEGNPVVYGHHHLNVSDAAEQQRLWIDVFGGTPLQFGANKVVKLPNVLIFMREQAPADGTKGSTVNHVGFSVPNLRAMLDRVRAAGIPIVTRAELPPATPIVDDIAHVAAADLNIAFIMAPDGIKIELVEDPAQELPVDLHHVHLAAANPTAVRDWYVATFGAHAGRSGAFETAELPGVSLSFLPAAEPPAGTQGRSLDHLGFEIDGLAAFCRQLEADGVEFDRPYTEIPERGLALAYFTDPWGTYIELTEGLDRL
jgi:catechol 2,3-dioxygenase-like lactoylglutathione lyase family enzyme